MSISVEGFEPILAALQTGATDYFDDPAAELRSVSRLERTFSSLLRVHVSARARSFHVFVKIFKPRSGTPDDLAQLRRWVEREFAATARLHAEVEGHAGLAAVRPIAVFPDRLALVTEEAAGLPMDAVIRDAQWGRPVPAPLPEVAFHVGAWIRLYQDVTSTSGTLSLGERREYLDVRLQRLVDAQVISAVERAAALERFDALADAIAPGALALSGIHADLCPPNILVARAGVTILDFAMAKTGARLHDLSHLYLHLAFQRWRPRPRQHLLDEAQTQLLAGYDRALTPRDPQFQLLLLQHVVCHVALVAEQTRGAVSPVRRSLARRRWRKCCQLDAITRTH